MKAIKNFINRVLYPDCYSSERFVEVCRRGGAIIGENVCVYSPKTVWIDPTSLPYIEIGDNVQITKDCIILGHDYSYSVCAKALDIVPRQQKITKIGNNVFLGMRSIILMGAEIGDNTIIGAGSVVHGKIESDSVYAGNPAKKIASLNRYMEKYIEIRTR